MRMRGGVRRFQTGGANVAPIQNQQGLAQLAQQAGAARNAPQLTSANSGWTPPAAGPSTPPSAAQLAAAQQANQAFYRSNPSAAGMFGVSPSGAPMPGAPGSQYNWPGAAAPAGATPGGAPMGGPAGRPPMPMGGGSMGGAQTGPFTAGAPGNSLGAAPGLNPQAIQQALQQRRSMAGGPPAPGGPAGAPATGWPGTPGMPPQGMMPQAMPPQGSLGAMAPQAAPGMQPQLQGMQANPQALQAALAQMQQQGQRPPGMRRGGKAAFDKDKAAEDVPEKKARGGLGMKPVKRRKPPAAPKMARPKLPPPPPPGGLDEDEDAGPPPSAAPPMGAPPAAGAMPGMKKGGSVHGADCDCAECSGKMAKGGKWIQGAIKKPGALHAQLGIPQGKKIPAKTLAKAAGKGGKLGQRARLAQMLKKMHKAKGGACDDKMAKGGISKFNSTKPAPGNLATHPGSKKMAKGGAMKVRRGFPNVNRAPQRLARGGKVRGGGAATKGLRFEGVY